MNHRTPKRPERVGRPAAEAPWTWSALWERYWQRPTAERVASRHFSRNQLLNESAEVYREGNAGHTDILHEYFVPPAQLAPLLRRLRAVIPRHGVDLLNVTVRDVRADNDTFLRYADQDLFALMMLFHQPRTPDGGRRMEALTRELIAAAIECRGRYYLPYRLHATRGQLERAYPQARAFFQRKLRHDPGELFQNQFYLRYGRP